MYITELKPQHLEAAQSLLLQNYREECGVLPTLPAQVSLPPLDILAQNGLGVAALQGEELIGFLGAVGPWRPAFYTPDVCGVYVPLHAHGAQAQGRADIYRRMYGVAAEKWVRAGAASHTITLYAHDDAAREAFFMYGFGARCTDMLRSTERPLPAAQAQYTCAELPPERHGEITALRKHLADHLAQSPCFMKEKPEKFEEWLHKRLAQPPRVFTAQRGGSIAAYMELAPTGENFITYNPCMQNICGAYCLPQYRGSGAALQLLQHVTTALRSEGCTCLGVDCETFNPAAMGFWGKYFSPYTYSLVRRIDENALLK